MFNLTKIKLFNQEFTLSHNESTESSKSFTNEWHSIGNKVEEVSGGWGKSFSSKVYNQQIRY